MSDEWSSKAILWGDPFLEPGHSRELGLSSLHVQVGMTEKLKLTSPYTCVSPNLDKSLSHSFFDTFSKKLHAIVSRLGGMGCYTSHGAALLGIIYMLCHVVMN